jgi:TRAP-type C4-dicarboxylate transport system permease small subunit
MIFGKDMGRAWYTATYQIPWCNVSAPTARTATAVGAGATPRAATPKTKQIAKLTTAVVLAAIAIVLCAYAFIVFSPKLFLTD